MTLVLRAAAEELRQAAQLEEVQRIIRSSARWLLQADGATLVLRDGEHCYYADEDAMSPLWKGQRFPMTNCISGWAMMHGDTAVIPDITLDARIPQEAYRPTFVRSLAMVPIRPSQPIGAIGAYWAVLHGATPAEVQLLNELAAAADQALSRFPILVPQASDG